MTPAIGYITRIYHKLDLARFFQGTGPQPQPHLTHLRNVYIFPTRTGVFFAVVLFTMLLGAINYSNSLGYLFTFLLGSFALVCILHTYRNLLNLSATFNPVSSVYAGETISFSVNVSSLVPFQHLALEMGFPHGEKITRDTHEGLTRFIVPIETDKRGLHDLPRLVLSSRFPAGLFRAWTHVHFNGTYIVYPAPAQNVPQPPAGYYHLSVDGEKGHGTDDFIGLRNFHTGDSLKHIHWKAMAKQQNLLTKQFGGDRSEEQWFDFNLLDGYTTEQRLSILTRWIIDADLSGYEYGLRLPGIELKPAHGEKHKKQCLQKLALYPGS